MVQYLGRVETDLGVETRLVEALDPGAYEATLTNLGNEGVEVVVATFGEMIHPISQVAPQFPDTRFVILFADPYEEPFPNVTTVSYDFYQGSYLAGMLAGAVTESSELGYIGGMSLPQLNADFNAFHAGAQSIDPSITTSPAFAASFNDPAKGRELGASMYASGVDVIFGDAAGTELGIFEAAEERGAFVIGTSNSTPELVPENGLGYVFLNMGQSLYDEAERALADGEYEGGHLSSGMAEDVVQFIISETFLEQGPEDVVAIVREMMPQIEQAREDIINGDLEVPHDTDI